ncbi:MAG: hypothetical protein IPM18_12435 [Phycisphaerales bacterium]|nr:hypothetical protein [Phycisphaerales bacterium]
MSFGPVTIFTVDTMGVQAPGAPGLTAVQLSNRASEFTLTPPTTDADGSPLSGLTFGQAVVIQADAVEADLSGGAQRSAPSDARRSART